MKEFAASIRWDLAQKEAAMLRLCKHPHICEFVEEINGAIVTELLEGDLFDRVPLAESDVRHLLRQLISAVRALHQHGVAHLDLKPENVCFDHEDKVKLIDFGSARFFDSDDEALSTTTPAYAPPEAFVSSDGVPASPRTDIFSLGVLAVVCLTGHLSPHISRRSIRALVVSRDDLTEDARSFCLWCLEDDPEKRPSATQLLAHPFLSSSSV